MEELADEPGFHWSDPGIYSLAFNAGGRQHRCVMKRLGQHSKREVLIYRFLSVFEEFPMPKLYYSMTDDVTEDYWFLMEQCFANPSATDPSVFLGPRWASFLLACTGSSGTRYTYSRKSSTEGIRRKRQRC